MTPRPPWPWERAKLREDRWRKLRERFGLYPWQERAARSLIEDPLVAAIKAITPTFTVTLNGRNIGGPPSGGDAVVAMPS